MEFTKKDVAAQYDLVGEHNPRIAAGNYNGLLADAPLAVVKGMAERKSQYVKAKASPPAAEPKASK